VNVDLLGELYDGYIMIRTVAELLRALQEAEIRQIQKAGIRHAPTIGEMYEGLTSSILDKTIPSEAGLRVVSGFVENGSGMQSGQIDCMLVFGGFRRKHAPPVFEAVEMACARCRGCA